MDSEHWYALQLVVGREKALRDRIMDTSLVKRILFPKRMLEIRREGKAHKVTKPLLPGYLLLAFDKPLTMALVRKISDMTIPSDGLGLTLRFLGVPKEVGLNSDTTLTEIPPSEMTHLLFLTSNGENECVPFSDYEKVGSKVKVISGPLMGYESIIQRVNPRKKRITISLKLFGVEREVDIGGEMVERA